MSRNSHLRLLSLAHPPRLLALCVPTHTHTHILFHLMVLRVPMGAGYHEPVCGYPELCSIPLAMSVCARAQGEVRDRENRAPQERPSVNTPLACKAFSLYAISRSRNGSFPGPATHSLRSPLPRRHFTKPLVSGAAWPLLAARAGRIDSPVATETGERGR